MPFKSGKPTKFIKYRFRRAFRHNPIAEDNSKVERLLAAGPLQMRPRVMHCRPPVKQPRGQAGYRAGPKLDSAAVAGSFAIEGSTHSRAHPQQRLASALKWACITADALDEAQGRRRPVYNYPSTCH